jgi:alginate biosynthesis protein Alg44
MYDNSNTPGSSSQGQSIMPHPADLTANQHPVLDVRYSVIMDGRMYEGAGLSIAGGQVIGLVSQHMVNERRLATLMFPFAGYSVAIPVDIFVETASSTTGAMSFHLNDPAGPHLPQLRHILNAYIAGEIVNMNGILSATIPQGQKSGGAKAKGRRSPAAFARGLGLSVAALLLLGFVGAKAYERAFVTPVGGLSVVTAQGQALRAIGSGQLEYVNEAAAKGDAVFAIRNASGQVVTVNMECDCAVLPGHMLAGATVVEGETVAQIAAKDAPVVVRTLFSPKDIYAIAGGAQVEVSMPGQGTIKAELDPASLSRAILSAAGPADIEVGLIPQTPIGRDSIGKPVAVRINNGPLLHLIDDLRAKLKELAK